MSYYDSNRMIDRYRRADGAAIDASLRAHMLRVYNYMAGGLAVTGVVAYGSAASGFYQSIAGTPLIWVVMLAPLAFVFALSFGIERMSAGTAAILFVVYAAVMGMSLGGIFLVFTDASIDRVFFITAATYGAMSFYVGVIVFVGLTAYDTQRIKEMYLESDSEEIAGKKAIIGALALYLDFINLFLLLLQLFGQRRQD